MVDSYKFIRQTVSHSFWIHTTLQSHTNKWAAMSKYPGENTNLPKNILESLSNVGLNHLVPKDGLSAMIDSPLIASLVRSSDLDTITSSTMGTVQTTGIPLDTIAHINQEKLVFKRPKALSHNGNTEGQKKSLFDGLSSIAKSCLDLTNCEVESEDIRSLPVENNQSSVKRKYLEEKKPGPDTCLDLGSFTANKRSHVGSTVTVNNLELGAQYISNLHGLVECINEGPATSMSKIETWIPVGDNIYVLSEKFLTTLQMTLKNIVAIPNSWNKVEVEILVKLLEVLVENIKISSAFERQRSNDVLSSVSHLSCTAIFIILQSENNDRRLLKDEYVLAPTNFINEAFENLKEKAKDCGTVKDQLISLCGSISSFSGFLKKRPSIDEGLMTRIVYSICNMLMSNDFESSANLQVQTYKENIRSISTEILVTVFSLFPDQREFIIEELVTNIERLPTKRTQRRLKKIDSETYVTDFTFTIISMLELLNSYESCRSISKNDENFIDLLEEKYKKSNHYLEYYTNRISETILHKCIHSFAKHRHSLENYIQDLIALLPYPTWSLSQYLLSGIMKKLLLVLNSSNQQSANIETVVLQMVGSVGASIFDIKCKTLPNQGSNSIQLCNYPDLLPQYLNSFQECLNFTVLNSSRRSATEILWHQRLGVLLSLWGYTKEEKEENTKVGQLIMEKIASSFEISELSNYTDKRNCNFGDIQYHYNSVLHTLELLNLYEAYLKTVLCLLGSEKIKVRSTAIKCLSMLASRDQNILSSPRVKNTIEKALSESSASVIDAILDLIGTGSSSVEFYKQINMNYDHESISVRKHVLRMNKKIYDDSRDREIKVFVASKILLKIEDEEDAIIEMAKSVLLEKWILPIASEESSEVQVEICKDVISVMSGVSNVNEKGAQHFEWFLNFFLLNKAMHTPARYNSIIRCLNQLTNILVQYIVDVQETDSKSREQEGARTDYLNLLAKFSDCYVSFITKDHIIALYPYLHSDFSSDLHYYILLVFKNTVENLGSFKPKFLYELETTLLSRLPRMNVKEIDQAMPLIWHVSNKRGDISRLTRACSSCFQHLNPYIKQANMHTVIAVEGKLQRLLYLATGFARFCNFGGKSQKPQFVNDDESVYAYVAKCLLVLSREGIPHLIRRMAIKNLSQLCCAHPKLFNSKLVLELLDKELEEGQMDVKLVILESLYDFFTLEERKSIKKVGVKSSVSSNKALKAKVLHERKAETVNDGICSALVTRFLKSVLQICLLEDIRSSLVAVRLLKLVLQYGYTNPSHCIPTIIALVGSTNAYMSFVAEEIMNEVFQRYETMVFAGISQGIKLCLEYSKTLEKEFFYKNNTFLYKVKTIVDSGKKYSSKFFKTVLRVLKIHFDHIMGTQCDMETKDAIIFLVSNLCTFQTITQHEIVLLLWEIDLASEQFREAITDTLVENSKKKADDSLINVATVEKCLREVRSYLILLYGIKPESMVNVQEDFELKNKELTVQNSEMSFIPNLIAMTSDPMIEEKLTEYDNHSNA